MIGDRQRAKINVAISTMGEIFRGERTTRQGLAEIDTTAEIEAKLLRVSPYADDWRLQVAAIVAGVDLTYDNRRSTEVAMRLAGVDL